MSQAKESELMLGLMQVAGRIHHRLGNALSVHGLGVSEHLVLRQLAAAPGQKMRRVDLARAVGLSASGVTRLLNPMEKIGLVDKEASPRDARVSLVTLSKAGARALDEADVAVASTAGELMAPLSADHRQQLLAILGAIGA